MPMNACWCIFVVYFFSFTFLRIHRNRACVYVRVNVSVCVCVYTVEVVWLIDFITRIVCSLRSLKSDRSMDVQLWKRQRTNSKKTQNGNGKGTTRERGRRTPSTEYIIRYKRRTRLAPEQKPCHKKHTDFKYVYSV